MDKLSSQFIFIFALTACWIAGCRESTEQKLGLSYQAPDVPSEIKQFYKPSPNEKAIELLSDGETKIDMHEYYRELHRSGWNDAIYEYDRNPKNRQFKCAGDVRSAIHAMKIGCDAYWIGYDEAYRQIDTALRNR